VQKDSPENATPSASVNRATAEAPAPYPGPDSSTDNIIGPKYYSPVHPLRKEGQGWVGLQVQSVAHSGDLPISSIDIFSSG